MGVWERLGESLYNIDFGETVWGLLGSVWAPLGAISTLQAYSVGNYFDAGVCAVFTASCITLVYQTLEPYLERRKRYKMFTATQEMDIEPEPEK